MPRADRRRKFRVLPSLAVLAVVSLVAACAQQPIAPEQPRVEAPRPADPAPQAPVAQEPARPDQTRVAMLVPLSGPAASAGQGLLNAGQMAVFDIAQEDFILQPYDTKGTAAGAREAASKAVAEGAQVILGPLFAESVRAIAPQAQAANVKIVSFSTDTTVAGNGIYVMGLLLTEQAQALVSFARTQGLERFAVLAPASDYGRAMATAFRDAAGQAGAQVTAVEFYSPGGPPDEAVKRLAQAGGFQAVLVPERAQKLREVAAMMPFHGIRPEQTQVLGTLLWADDRDLGREPALVGAWYPVPSPQSREYFTTRYREAYGTEPPAIASLGYDAAALAAVLASRSADATPFDDADLTNANGFMGVDGLFRLERGGLVDRTFAIMRVTPNGSELIAPAPDAFTPRVGS